jgi:hypothetical protein
MLTLALMTIMGAMLVAIMVMMMTMAMMMMVVS